MGEDRGETGGGGGKRDTEAEIGDGPESQPHFDTGGGGAIGLPFLYTRPLKPI